MHISFYVNLKSIIRLAIKYGLEYIELYLNNRSKRVHSYPKLYSNGYASITICLFILNSYKVSLLSIPKIMESEDPNIFDHVYSNNDSKSSDDKDESILSSSLVNSLKKDEFCKSINQLQFMRSHVPKFDDTSKAYIMICND